MAKKTFIDELKNTLDSEEAAYAKDEVSLPKKRGFFAEILFILRRRVIAGLLLTAPIVIGLFPVFFLYPKVNELAGKLADVRFMPDYLAALLQKPLPGFFLTLLLFLIMFYTIGLFSTTYAMRKVLGLGEKLVTQIPVVSFFYKTTKQVSDLIVTTRESTGLLKLVVIQYPPHGVFGVGFATGETKVPGRGSMVHVFIPFTPFPHSGTLLLVDAAQVFETNLSSEMAVKFVVSGGIIRMDTLELRPYRTMLAEASPDPAAGRELHA